MLYFSGPEDAHLPTCCLLLEKNPTEPWCNNPLKKELQTILTPLRNLEGSLQNPDKKKLNSTDPQPKTLNLKHYIIIKAPILSPFRSRIIPLIDPFKGNPLRIVKAELNPKA